MSRERQIERVQPVGQVDLAALAEPRLEALSRAVAEEPPRTAGGDEVAPHAVGHRERPVVEERIEGTAGEVALETRVRVQGRDLDVELAREDRDVLAGRLDSFLVHR